MKASKKAVIVIPTYNEKENIERIIPALEEIFLTIPKHYVMHILVVDDTSPDGTQHAVKKLQKNV